MTGTKKKVLVVEDEDDIREVLCSALEIVCKFTVEPCASGDQAVAKAAAFDPDLILVDVTMPRMDGPTTLGKLHEIAALETTPIIFVTAKAMPAELAHFKSLGALGVIVKPFDPMAICDENNALLQA